MSGAAAMSLAVNSINAIIAAQGVSGDLAFTPGSVIAARVLSVSPDNQVRIAIGNHAIDVQSQVPLQAGQTLQLAVSQTSDGIRLAVIPVQAQPSQAQAPQTGSASFDSVTLAPGAPVNLATTLAATGIQLTALEATAVSAAAQSAVTQQASLATLFANLGAITSLQGLPMPLQQAVAQLLAQRPPLDTKLSGDEVKSAFQNSGLFLEASLASASTTGALPQGVMPDMKAALIVLRQALAATLANAGATKGAPLATITTPGLPTSPTPLSANGAGNAVPELPATTATLVPTITPATVAQGTAQQQAAVSGAGDPVDPAAAQPQAGSTIAGSPDTAAHVAVKGAELPGLQQSLQGDTKPVAMAPPIMLDDGTLLDLPPLTRPQGATLAANAMVGRSNVPPPPMRGALPTPQPMTAPTLAAHASLTATVQHLLVDTDAALARQTLLQVASLPDSANAPAARLDQAAPRWNFEIPFAIPNGTAVAQFEISRDGGHGNEAEARHVWRARFSLDIEPAGPVHAMISLTGDKTSVRIWAERAATALQLQAGSAQLSQALVRANLQPGDIVIREGAPVQPAPAAAGHFLDRAL
jgi:hypothetical protein